jgi:hypothetical protein
MRRYVPFGCIPASNTGTNQPFSRRILIIGPARLPQPGPGSVNDD